MAVVTGDGIFIDTGATGPSVGGTISGGGITVTRDISTATLLGTATVSDPSLGDETGIYDFVGTDGAGAFEEIEHMVGTVYDDVLSGEDGHDDLAGGSAADRLDGGVNDDFLTGGTGDDTFVMSDGGGMDTITDFDMGDADANGFTNDQLDLPGLTDAGGNPVHVNDIVVGDDGAGNAVLTFPMVKA